MRVWRGLVAGACLAVGLSAAWARDFPAKTVRIIVPYGAGTATDTLARALAEPLGRRWQHGAAVENVTGAGGVVGTQQLQRAQPDGHTIALIASGHAMNVAIYPNLPYDPIEDFTPVMGLALTAMVLVAPPQAFRSLADLVEQAKTRPGTIYYGSTGNGSLPHLTVALFERSSGIRLIHVPYRGTPQMMPDLLTNRVSLAAIATATALPQVQSGKLVALAVSTPRRSTFLPDVPSASELQPGYDVSAWLGLIVPKGTPAQIVEAIREDVGEAMRSERVAGVLAKSGLEPAVLGAEEFWRRAAAEVPKWKRLVEDSGIKAD